VIAGKSSRTAANSAYSAWWCWGCISKIGQRLWDLVQDDEGLFAAFGLHPAYLDEHRPADLTALGDWLTRLRGHRQLCAVGEIGLDYFLEHLDRERQQHLFEAQLKMAVDFQLPALLHVRRSHAAVIATLKRIRLPRGGIIHAFAGSREEAREYIKLGFKLGLGGAATWPQALRMHKVLAQLPLDAVGTGNRCTGHGPRHASQPAQQPGTPARDLRRVGRAHGPEPVIAGAGEHTQRVRAVQLVAG
jgi:Tat protein secretion system quality control protein TatD with DNase activity